MIKSRNRRGEHPEELADSQCCHIMDQTVGVLLAWRYAPGINCIHDRYLCCSHLFYTSQCTSQHAIAAGQQNRKRSM